MKNVVILAAGMGTRFNSNEPKSLSAVNNQSALSRIITQAARYIPDAKITIVVGHNADKIKHHTARYGVEYVHNDKFSADKNIWSGILGAKTSKGGLLFLEGDCVYDDLAFREMATSLGKDSVKFLGGKADQNKTNGIVRIKKGVFDDYLIGTKEKSVNGYYDMVGALWISASDRAAFIKEASLMAKAGLDRYYFEPMFDKKKFRLKCKTLSGRRYSFNTKEEYQTMLRHISKVEYFDVSKLKHIEGFSKKRVSWLKKKILDEKMWTRPICIDPDGLVMDGQHRTEVSKQLGLKRVPVLIFHYHEVEIYSLRDTHEVSVELIKNRVAKDDIYPYKTVKHRFPVEITDCNISLDSLL